MMQTSMTDLLQDDHCATTSQPILNVAACSLHDATKKPRKMENHLKNKGHNER